MIRTATMVCALAATAALHVACCCCTPPDPVTVLSPSGETIGEIADALDEPITSGPITVGASCDIAEAKSRCKEYDTAVLTQWGDETFRSLCDLDGGTWSPTPCPTTDIAGTCDHGGGTLEHLYTTGGSAYTAHSGRDWCEMMGSVWQPEGVRP